MSHFYTPWKRQKTYGFFQTYCIFSEQGELQQGYIAVINYDISLVSGMYKLKDSLLFYDLNAAIRFFYLSLFHSTWSDPLCQGHCVYFTKTSVTASGLWLIRENLKGTVFVRGKPLYSCSFKGAYLFYRTSCKNVCLHPSHSFMVNALIWQIHNSNCSYSLSIVNFLKNNYRHLLLQVPKSRSFRVFSLALIFFWGTAVFRGSYC